MILLDSIVEKNNDKSKVLKEIFLYIFNIKITLSLDDLDDYYDMMKYIIDAIDGDNIQLIVFPQITRIYASSYLQKYLELYLKYIIEKKTGNNKIEKFLTLFNLRKQLWSYIQRIMLKILYYNILNENFEKLKNYLEKEELNELFKGYIENMDDNDLKNIIESNYINEKESNNLYYSFNLFQKSINIEKLKETILLNKEKYSILSTYFEYLELIKKGNSFINKLNDILVINNFENPLLNYYNFIERLSRSTSNKTFIETEIKKIKYKINNIEKKYIQFKNTWNQDFTNFSYQKEGKNETEKIKQINSNSYLEDILLDSTIEKNDEKSKVLIEIFLYLFNMKISLSLTDLEEYYDIMKYIIDAIDGDNVKFIIFPQITRIYASSFLHKYLELYLKFIIEKKEGIFKFKKFPTLFDMRKELWAYVQRIMLKILYYNILDENFEDLKNNLKNEELNRLFQDYIKVNDNILKNSIESNTIDEKGNNKFYYSFNRFQKPLNIKKLKETILLNKEKKEM